MKVWKVLFAILMLASGGYMLKRGVTAEENLVAARGVIEAQLTQHHKHLCEDLKRNVFGEGMRILEHPNPNLVPARRLYQAFCGSGIGSGSPFEWMLDDTLDIREAARRVRDYLDTHYTDVRLASAVCEEKQQTDTVVQDETAEFVAWEVLLMKRESHTMLGYYCRHRAAILVDVENPGDRVLLFDTLLPVMRIGALSAAETIGGTDMVLWVGALTYFPGNEEQVRAWLALPQHDRKIIYWILSDIARSLRSF